MAIAMTNGYDEEWTNLSKAPASVNAIVGGTKENPRHWHGIELDDHSDLISVQSTPQDALSESGSEQISDSTAHHVTSWRRSPAVFGVYGGEHRKGQNHSETTSVYARIRPDRLQAPRKNPQQTSHPQFRKA